MQLFRSHSVQVSGTGGEARALVAMQQTLYETVFTTFHDVPFRTKNASGSTGSGSAVDRIFNHCRPILTSSPAEISQQPGFSLVSGELPILQDDDVQRLREFVRNPLADRTADDAQQLGYQAVAALLVECTGKTRAKLLAEVQGEPVETANILFQAAAYAAARRSIQDRTLATQAVSGELASITGAVANHRAEFEKERLEQRGALDALAAAGIEIDQKVSAASEGLDAFKESLLNRETAIREEWKLDRARLNWNDRFTEARAGFRIACGLLAAYLIVTCAIAYAFGPDVVASVNHFDLGLFISGGSVGTAIAHQISRLVVFSVPIFVYLWLLKTVIRYFMRSLLLMDDARQRETMLDTYLLLTEKGRADERDRPLILWALFRQTPGHGPDGIEPPDFTEVINTGLRRAQQTA